MQYYLKGYYGYKNLGDELLLFWVLAWLSNEWNATKIVIESGDPIWLTQWLKRHHAMMPSGVEIYCVGRSSAKMYNKYHLVLGGGEVLTDARRFPYGGRNYIIKHFWRIVFWKFSLLWGIWRPRMLTTRLLYALLIPRAKHIVVRDKDSYAVAYMYHENPVLHSDFAYPIIDKIVVEKDEWLPYNVINLNPYKRDTLSKRKVEEIVEKHTGEWIFIAWDVGEDIPLYRELQISMERISLFDWTSHNLREIANFFASAQYGLATRLHVLLLLKHFNIPLSPLVYQEKITKVLWIEEEHTQ
jgi:polysaccharide pyruvyl transferase WcaK-like protein